MSAIAAVIVSGLRGKHTKNREKNMNKKKRETHNAGKSIPQ